MRIATATLLVFCSGCFVVTDLDRFQNPCEGDTSVNRPFRASLRDMDMFSGAPTTIRLVDASNISVPSLVAVAVLDGIDTAVDPGETNFTMPNAVLAGDSYNAQVFVDLERNGFAFADDPGWSREVCDSGLFVFQRDESFVDVDDPRVVTTGMDFRFTLIDFGPHTTGTQKLELMVVERETGRSVGFYRLPNVELDTFDVVIPGIIEPSREYNIEFYADFDQDGRYTEPGADHSWVRIYTNEDTSSHSFTHLADFDPLTVF
jgi:hypothetical protein